MILSIQDDADAAKSEEFWFEYAKAQLQASGFTDDVKPDTLIDS